MKNTTLKGVKKQIKHVLPFLLNQKMGIFELAVLKYLLNV